jgi:ABC-2 type transport system ATP-binding protein
MIDNNIAVHLDGVRKSFGSQVAVHNLDLAVPKGTIFGFIGPNGSGKTTTMRMILRIYKPDSGQVNVLGDDVGDVADDRVGYLPEERGLYRRMTVRRVLRYFARLKGVKRPDAVITEHLERMGAQDWGNKKIEQLSKGMAQKIQFIVAVISKPQLIILDEPFSGLDPVNMEMLRDAVLELKKNGTTVIFSTHDMEMAEKMCDRVFMIYKGKKVLDGTLDEIKSGHGANVLRVRMADGSPLPESIPGVNNQIQSGRFVDLQLESESMRSTVLRNLATVGDVEHFETVRPSLHDIFVRIARI